LLVPLFPTKVTKYWVFANQLGVNDRTFSYWSTPFITTITDPICADNVITAVKVDVEKQIPMGNDYEEFDISSFFQSSIEACPSYNFTKQSQSDTIDTSYLGGFANRNVPEIKDVELHNLYRKIIVEAKKDKVFEFKLLSIESEQKFAFVNLKIVVQD